MSGVVCLEPSTIRTVTVGSGLSPGSCFSAVGRNRLCASARGLIGFGFPVIPEKLRRITAGGDFHPAPKIHVSRKIPRPLYSVGAGALQ